MGSIARDRSARIDAKGGLSGITGSSIVLLCQMMKGLVCAWLGEFDES